MPTTKSLLGLVAVALMIAIVDYILAFGTGLGLQIDRLGMPGHPPGVAWVRAHHALSAAVHTIDVATIALFGLLAIAVAFLRRRPELAGAAALLLAGSNLTTHLLKPAVGNADVLGGEAHRVIANSFPSGHATAAMSLALAVVIVVPARWRPVSALAGAAYAALVGVGLVILQAHYPSDVIAGYALSVAWGGVAVAGAYAWRARSGRETPRPNQRAVVELRRATAGSLVVLAAVGVAWAVVTARDSLGASGNDAHAGFFVAAMIIGLAAAAFVMAMTRLLQPYPPARSSHSEVQIISRGSVPTAPGRLPG